MDTNAPAPKPDMMEQMKKLLERYSMGDALARRFASADRDNALLLASALLAVAGELRDIHNMLADVRDSNRAIGGSLAALVGELKAEYETGVSW